MLQPLLDLVGSAIQTGMHEDPFQRDPAVVARMLPLIKLINRYFGTEVRGWANLPRRGPFLVVGNHSGGAETTDLWFLLERWVVERGPEAPLYALAYNLLFAYPVIGPLLRWLGVLPASHANAQKALARGAAVVVFPGGDYEVFRPWRERNRIEFGGHMGFIQLAITAGVPVVPMTIHGAHQSTIVITRGRRLARLMGIDRLRVNVFPFVWSIPFGVVPAFVPTLPLPAKVTVQIGRPLNWARYSAAQAHDPKVLQQCYDEITTVMQRTMDRLAAEHPYPVLGRLNELRPSRILRKLAVG
jgi:1-acyl-sn-glycerol-3-phosphate acyltransferase